MPVKPLAFKGDKKPRLKKRKHRDEIDDSPHVHTNARNDGNPEDEDDDGDDETTWVTPDAPSDLSGPTILVLPTSPPTALASDTHGNIFASPLENVIDSNPLTAEPHDVRQVWVATRVAGMGEGHVSFKGAHGGYLSCDDIGVLGARREARGTEEGFVIELNTDDGGGGSMYKGQWRVRTSMNISGSLNKIKDGQERYLIATTEASDDNDGDDGGDRNDDESEDFVPKNRKKQRKIAISLRGDGEKNTESTRLVIKMQAKFKPKLQRDKEQRKSEKVSRAELEKVVGRRLQDDEVRRLKKAKKNGTYYEEILDVRVKGKHDKFA